MIRYVLIPGAARAKNVPQLRLLFSWRLQVLHNANLAMCAVEMVLGRVPLRMVHVPVGVLWGLHYVGFAWAWMLRTGGVVYYPFLDPTVPPSTSLPIHVALVAAFAAFFAFGVLLGGSDDLAVKVSALAAAVLGLTYTRAHGAPALLREAATA